MSDILLSSDFGLRWGNVAITPSELASLIKGIDLIDGLLVLDDVKFVNTYTDRAYIVDQEGKRHRIADLFERLMERYD